MIPCKESLTPPPSCCLERLISRSAVDCGVVLELGIIAVLIVERFLNLGSRYSDEGAGKIFSAVRGV